MKKVFIGFACCLSLLILGTWFFSDTAPSEPAIRLDANGEGDEVPALVQDVFDEYKAHLNQAEETALIERYQAQLFDRFDFVSFDGEPLWVDSEHFKYLSAPYHQLRKEWRESLGIFTKDDLASYAAYDIATLEALGNQGDLRAWHTLANIYTAQLDGDKLEEALNNAAIHGSASAIDRKGDLTKYGIYSFLSGTSSDLDKTALVGWLAHSEVAHRLGHPSVQASTLSSLERNNLLVHLTEADWQGISGAADSLFAELEASRQELGLGEFNTELPEHVIGYNQNRKDIRAFREAAERLAAQDNNN